MEINKLALQNFYESHVENYLARRNKGKSATWDEDYKWHFLPEANKALSIFNTVDSSNIKDVLSVINKYKSNFAHWIDMDDLNLLIEKPNGYQIVREVWGKQPDNIGQAVDAANNMSNFMLNKKFSPSTYGYILAAQNCDRFAIYRDSLLKKLADINHIEKSGSLTQGEKYQLLNDSASYIGELMGNEKQKYADLEWYTALNGQDFLYVTIQYQLDDR
ncbi:MAG: hypothetical protein EOT05_01020 [Candidatus Microsaccharimonas sossegonensis]|uniref:Uncharacterized protein n=1 Tax=Candidatus Microsaccharimonas sossegonensis TaxID=2506948 RepID=A0A4Q0AGQ7_9BACT|nr:MAG: hypothetical protein EOT05_01020 [Candidatus Microsaccharimonas sossegonensis]